MSNKTYRERLVAGLVEQGWTEDHSDKSKYTAFIKPGESLKRFVGRFGALRMGECASRSASLGDPQHISLIYFETLQAGDRLIARAEQAADDAIKQAGQ